MANVYEDLIEGTLLNKKSILDKFRDSRKQLAQIHVIDSARMADGLLDLQKLSSVVGKYGADKRMATGNIKTVADFANTFKTVTKPIEKSSFATPSRWELLMAGGGLGGASATGGASLMLATPTLARMTMPYLAEKGMLQGVKPNYTLNPARKYIPELAGKSTLETAFSPYIEENK